MRTETAIPILLAVALGAGCASVRPTDPYKKGDWPGAAASVPREFAAPNPGGPLELERAVEIALAANPDLAAARWDAAAARARHDLASGERLPRISATGGYMHHLDEQRLLPVRRPGDPSILSRDIVTGDLVLTVPIFTGGRLASEIRAADLLRDSADRRLARTREELVFNVSAVFFAILSQERVVGSLEFSRDALEEHLGRVEALVAARKAADVDRMRTEVRLADITQRLAKEKGALAIERRVLANLLGMDPGSEQLFVRGDLAQNLHEPIPPVDSTLAAALDRRPDYFAARASLEAQARMVDAARAGRWPNVSLFGTYGERWALGDLSGTGNERDDIGRIGLLVDLPLFEGGRIGARIEAERASLAAGRERLRKLEMQIGLEVETVLLDLGSSRERIDATAKAVDQARESLRIEQRKYELAKGAIVDVLDAQAALLESETNYYRALADYHGARARLKLAVGEGVR